MHITQGTFSYLPDLTDDQIRKQVQYAIDNKWSVQIEVTDDPHPRNVYWDMWGLPMFDLEDAAGAVYELNEARKAYSNHYIRLTAYDASRGRQTTALQFIVNRPDDEPGFRLERQETHDRAVRYTLHPYAAEAPHGSRYADGAGNYGN